MRTITITVKDIDKDGYKDGFSNYISTDVCLNTVNSAYEINNINIITELIRQCNDELNLRKQFNTKFIPENINIPSSFNNKKEIVLKQSWLQKIYNYFKK
jgi:hypothetical protein